MALPNPFQKLKHGALLCKKNFNTFVETFNFLVDFAQNLRGDGDANGSGSIVVDRSVPDRPVIRSKINIDYPFGTSTETVLPWTFDGTRWINCILQLGYDKFIFSPDIYNDSIIGNVISGTDQTSDGEYCVEINPLDKTAVIVQKQKPLEPIDISTGKITIYIGEISGGVQSKRIPNHLVVSVYQ